MSAAGSNGGEFGASFSGERRVGRHGKRTIPPWYICASSVGLSGFVYLAAFHRDILPYGSLSFIGSLLHWLAYDHQTMLLLGWWILIAIHVVEAIYGLTLSRRIQLSPADQFKWFMQNLILGYPSLRLLIKMVRRMEKTS